MTRLPMFGRAGVIAQLLALALLVMLTACGPDPHEKVAVSITGINYTYESVEEFYVNGAWAGNLPAYGGGGKTVCCVMLPRTWTAGLQAEVTRTIGHFTRPYAEFKDRPVSEWRACCWTERTLTQTVPVQKYDRPAKVQVFFLPDDKVEIWVFDATPPNPNHPSGRPYPVDPHPREAEEK